MDPQRPDKDILFVPDAGKASSELEARLEAYALEHLFQYGTVLLTELTTRDFLSPVIFYAPKNPGNAQTEVYLKGFRKRNNNNAIIVACEPTLEELILARKTIDNLHTIPLDADKKKIESLFGQLQPHLRESRQLQAPWALVISENDGKNILDSVQAEDYNVKHLEGKTVDPALLGQYQAMRTPFQVIIIEGNNNIKTLPEVVREKWPAAYISCVAGESLRREIFDRAFLWWNKDRDLGKGIRAFLQQHRKVEAFPASRTGKCYIVAGPSAAGKSEAGLILSENNPNMIVVQKHTTRKPRPGEEQGRHMLFRSMHEMQALKNKKNYFLTYTVNGYLYGIPNDIVQKLKSGDDALLTVTTLDHFKPLVNSLNSISEETAVPILMYASQEVLESRLLKRRAPFAEKEKRFSELESQRRKFFEHLDWFKYAINSGESTVPEVNNILAAIVQWESRPVHQSYVEAIQRKVLPADFIHRVMRGKESTLAIPDEIINDYAAEKNLSLNDLQRFQKHPISAVSDAYGRLSILMPPPEDIPGRRGRDIVLDLIERTVELIPRARYEATNYLNISIFGKCTGQRMYFNDGLLYMLGDDVFEHPVAGKERYAVSFGFIRSSGKQKPQPIPLTNQMKQTWSNWAATLRKFPLNPFDNQ